MWKKNLHEEKLSMWKNYANSSKSCQSIVLECKKVWTLRTNRPYRETKVYYGPTKYYTRGKKKQVEQIISSVCT